MENELSEQLKLFIREYVRSLEELEVLLITSNEPDRLWTAEEVFKMTQSNITSVSGRLKSLADFGLLIENHASGRTYRYSPKSPELAQKTDELKRIYSQSKYKVIEAIFSMPRSQAQRFADSFKLKQKE